MTTVDLIGEWYLAAHLHLTLLNKQPFRQIDGESYCLWSYRLSWSGHPSGLQRYAGLVCSSRIPIKDPTAFADVPEVHGTTLVTDPSQGTQTLYKTIPPAGATALDLSFIAPCAEDAFTALRIVSASASLDDWHPLTFSVDTQAPAAQTQTLRGPSAGVITTMPTPDPTPTSNTDGQRLDNSARRVSKATLVSIQLPRPRQGIDGAVPKFGFVSNLRLQPGEVDSARQRLVLPNQPNQPNPPNPADPHTTPAGPHASRGTQAPHAAAQPDAQVWSALKAFEGSPLPSGLPAPTVFGPVPTTTLAAFGRAIVGIRQDQLDRVRARQAPGVTQPAPRDTLVAQEAMAVNLHNAAVVALNAFEANFKVTPIGVLNLERLEMTPVGVERGALIATIPLAPLEQTAVVHKEWSVTTKEFTSIVTDSLENYSETGVTENTELAQATTSQTTHSNQFNVNGTVTGSYGPVTATVSSSFSAQNQDSQSANESRKHAIATTRKAASRVKQEHKVTISTTTVTGTSETSTRVLQNPSATDPIRIDYFSLMRKWHVGLYRYGLRLTYDIAIPEPASAMRKVYADIENLRGQVGPFRFPVQRASINATNYKALADQYNAQVPLMPAAEYTTSIAPTISVCPDKSNSCGIIYSSVPLPALKDGYAIEFINVDGGIWGYSGKGAGYGVVGTQFFKWDAQGDGEFTTTKLLDSTGQPFLAGAEGTQTIGVYINDVRAISMVFTIKAKLTDAAYEAWQLDVWNALFNAAQTQYFTQQQDLQAQIAALEDSLRNVDTLTLRREENEEIMKGVLRWLLGPNFTFMSNDVFVQFIQQMPIPGLLNPNANIDITHGTVLDATRGDGLNVTAVGWLPMFMYQEMVKFINEAIEWENVLYFLYSYFWDVPPSWNFIRQLRHPDATRQAFLRAGSARVVLTVRRGWEQAWVNFVEAGGFGDTLIPDHPYMTIAQEVQDYDETNYPGIPPANPAGGPLPDSGESVASVSRDTLTPSGGAPVTLAVVSSAGFHVGYTAIIDTWDTTMVRAGQTVTAQEAQVITAVPDDTHITVARIDNPHDGSTRPFPVMQAGEQGQLIAEWFEYTPTSGTDIAVTSNLATIA